MVSLAHLAPHNANQAAQAASGTSSSGLPASHHHGYCSLHMWACPARRQEEATCEGLGLMLCGQPAISVDGSMTVTMSNRKTVSNKQELLMTVRFGAGCGHGGRPAGMYRE